MAGRKWTKEEEIFLMDSWGVISVNAITKKLDRTETSIKIKARKLGLGSFLESGDYITFAKLKEALGYSNNTYAVTSWIERRGLPIINKKVGKRSVKAINLDSFWKWAEKNKSFLDFSNFEEFTLGIEPDWVKKKREYDIESKNSIKSTRWSQKDDEYLVFLLNEYKYTYKDISKRMNRAEEAICRRILELKLMQRPVKADSNRLWTDDEKKLVKKMILEGANYKNISSQLENRGVRAIRGLIYRTYNTESLDKVRNKIKEIDNERK